MQRVFGLWVSACIFFLIYERMNNNADPSTAVLTSLVWNFWQIHLAVLNHQTAQCVALSPSLGDNYIYSVETYSVYGDNRANTQSILEAQILFS